MPMNYLIAGLPKSGTTILFTRVREGLGGEIATYFEPRTEEQYENLFATGQYRDTLTKILIGAVPPGCDINTRFERKVLIVRDPRDQLISLLLYRFNRFTQINDRDAYHRARRLLEQKVHDPSSLSTVELFDRIHTLIRMPGIAHLVSRYHQAINYRHTCSPQVIRYEAFIDGDVAALERYLGITLPAHVEVDEMFRRVVRTRSYGEWRSWLTGEDLRFINEEMGGFMELFGYPVETAVSHPPPIPESTSLGYIRQFEPDASP
jgi:hypothetical protein